jgi:hypothetical protein
VSGEDSALLATIVVWLASGVVFYMFLHPSMSHANDIFVNSLVIAIWFRTRKNRTHRGWLALGASIGLATLVRQQNAIAVIFPAAEWLLSFWKNRDKRRWHTLASGILFALAGLVVFSPQFYVWHRVYGQWLVLNPYSATTGTTINFLRPRFFDVLFSINRSLFFYAPVLLPAMLGLWPMRHRAPRLTTMLFVSWVLQVYLVCSWSASGGAAFGRRVLLNSTPVYVIGLAALIKTLLEHRLSLRTLWIIGCGFIAWNFLLIAQYVTGLLPHVSRPESGWSVIMNQWRVIGVFLERLDEILSQRFSLWR